MEKQDHLSDQIILSEFNPLIAHVWQNTSTITDYADKFNHLLYCYEAILKYLAAMLYGRIALYSVDTTDIDNFIKENFDEPSFGDWSTLIRLSQKLLVNENDGWAKTLDEVIQRKVSCAHILSVYNITKKLQGFPSYKQVINIGEFIRSIIELRNRTKGHGAVRKGFYDDINDSLFHSVIDMLTIFKDIFCSPFFFVQKIDFAENPNHAITSVSLKGLSKKLVRFDCSTETALLSNRLYTTINSNYAECYSVWPFIYWDENAEDIYVFNMIKGERAEFISYKTGNNKFLDIGSFDNLFKIEKAKNQPKKILIPIQTSSKGIVHNLPSPDWYHFIPRPDIEQDFIDKLSHPRMFITTLDGIGGSGKTALALKIAFDIIENNSEYDYVVWVTAKRTKLEATGIKMINQSFSSLPDLLKEIFRVSGFEEYQNNTDLNILKRTAFDILSLARFLIIIDNLETVENASEIWQFLVDPHFSYPTKVIVTSRHRQESAELVVNVRGMTLEQVGQLIVDESSRLNLNLGTPLSSSIVKLMLDKTGGLPIAIKQVIAHSAKGLPLVDAINRLPSNPSDVLDFCFPESFKLLDIYAKRAFFSLFKLGEPVGFEELLFVSGLAEEELSKALLDLKSMSLIERSITEEQKELYYLLPLTVKYADREICNHINIEESILPRIAELNQLKSMMPFDQPISSISGIVTSERMLQLALSAASKGIFDKADYWFDKALSTDKNNPILWLAKAKYESKDKQDIESARKSFSKAIHLDSANIEALIHWGHLERTEKNWAKTKDLFNSALKIDTNNRRASHGLGLTLFEQGVYEKEFGKKQNETRRIHYGNQLIKEAIQNLLCAIIPSPKNEPDRHHNVVTYAVLSRAWNRINDNKRAKIACEEGLQLEPTNFRLLNWQKQLKEWN